MQSEAYTKCKDDINAWLEMRGGMKFTSLDAVRVAMPTLGGLIHAHLMHTAKKMKVNCYLDMNVDVTQRPFVQQALHTLQSLDGGEHGDERNHVGSGHAAAFVRVRF